jgi:hypothetical protein
MVVGHNHPKPLYGLPERPARGFWLVWVVSLPCQHSTGETGAPTFHRSRRLRKSNAARAVKAALAPSATREALTA